MGPPFPQALLGALREAPGSPAFEQGSRTVSRGELLELVRRLAGAMRAAGLGPGRAVAIRTAVSPEAFAAHIAAHTLGCRVVGVRPGYTAGQLAHVLSMDVDAVLVDPSTAAPELSRASGRPVPLLSLGPCPGADDLLTRPGDGGSLDVAAQPDAVAALMFTSGSTGRPKGCAITYRALSEHWAWQPRAWSPVAAEMAARFERYLLFGTLASMVVFEFLGLCLLGGGTAVIPEDDGRPLFPHAIERYGITGSIVTVPKLCRMLDLLRDEPSRAQDGVGRLRALMVSGSPIGPTRLAEAADRLGPVVYQGYGQTEAGSISMLTPDDIAGGSPRVLASVGRPHPGIEITVRDERDREVAPGGTGEIHVRAPSLMSGYWGMPEETRDTLRDGRLRTRDLGRLDADGLLHLTGRTRDVIMVNAMVVYAGPIERVLAAHPGVAEAYVAGAPDEATGEAVHAFVVPAAGAVPDRGALAALVRAELGDDSVPSTFTVVPGVPVAAGGKPDKRALLRLL
ncbi:long-chain fatty acid--CoA ligase [Actinomadura rubrisoli]|uniref:Long-chain fatty acid--CoA ligase n=1 Tax=Actinomadura rubrisoli TaxID=2530368 RepID=A0A4R5C198_9ACTN|nr:long-chain fatty acid--CoA ligase [Actinomadura rubrisoli]